MLEVCKLKNLYHYLRCMGHLNLSFLCIQQLEGRSYKFLNCLCILIPLLNNPQSIHYKDYWCYTWLVHLSKLYLSIILIGLIKSIYKILRQRQRYCLKINLNLIPKHRDYEVYCLQGCGSEHRRPSLVQRIEMAQHQELVVCTYAEHPEKRMQELLKNAHPNDYAQLV